MIIKGEMASNILKLAILTALAVVLLLGVSVLAISYEDIGITDNIVGRPVLSSYDFSAVPQSVTEDAARLALKVYGNTRGKYTDFVNQLLSSYMEAREKDFVVFFNSGGWGGNLLDTSPGWRSILNGIKFELDDLGYSSVFLNYRRTSETVWGRFKEFVEVVTRYPSKAEDLARRVEFLTSNLPKVRVIVTGESNGTAISDNVMGILRNDPKVYSIQTGTPFWHKRVTLDRTLVLNSNGVFPDTFSEGNIPAMVWATVKVWLHLAPAEEAPGTILVYLKAPGHDYSWQYPEVYSRITRFLKENFVVGRQLMEAQNVR